MATKPTKQPVEMVPVVALETGYDNIAVRNPGDKFLMPKGAKAHWFEPDDSPDEAQ